MMQFHHLDRMVAMAANQEILMQYVGFGLITFAVPLALIVLYLGLYRVRQQFAVWDGTAPPREQRRARVVMMGIIGLLVGVLAQPQWERAQECKNVKRPLFACMILDRAI
jgi:hypothetical protein